jgi:hypothetical protein
MADSPSLAVFDTAAFDALRALVEGPIRTADQLLTAERMLRAIVLHDDAVLEQAPMPRLRGQVMTLHHPDGSSTSSPLVALAPEIGQEFEGVLSNGDLRRLVTPAEEVEWMRLRAREHAGAGPGDPFYQTTVGYLQLTAGVLAGNGSVIGPLDAFEGSARHNLLPGLDEQWKRLLRELDEGAGFTIPPLIAIVMGRAASRGALVRVIADLKMEWADARRKLWSIVRVIRNGTLKERRDARRELAEASSLFVPTADGGTPPLRVFWTVFGDALAGVASAAVMGGVAGVDAALPALGGVVAKNVVAAGGLPDLGAYADRAFRRGAFDLARRVRQELLYLEPLRAMVRRHLSESERQRIGLS